MKGISQVLGAVLLMSITVGAVASAATFLNETQNQVKDNARDRIESQQDSQGEADIQYGYENPDGEMVIEIRNTGSEPITFETQTGNQQVSIFVDGPPVEWDYVSSKSTPFSLTPGSNVRIDTNQPFPAEGSSSIVRYGGPSDTQDSFTCYNSGTGSC